MKVNFEVEQRQAVGGNYSLLNFFPSVFSSLYEGRWFYVRVADFIWVLLILVFESIHQPMVLQKLVMQQLCMKACTLHKAASYSTKCFLTMYESISGMVLQQQKLVINAAVEERASLAWYSTAVHNRLLLLYYSSSSSSSSRLCSSSGRDSSSITREVWALT